MSNPPTLIRAGRVEINVSNMILKFFCLLNSFNSLANLKDLRPVAALRPTTPTVCWTMTPIREPKAIMKSKTFHLSLKYLRPLPSILKIASNMKIPLKTLLM